MKLARLAFGSACLAAAALGVFGATMARGADVESAVQHAQSELDHAAHADPEHSSTASDPLSIDPDLALWTLIVFLLLLAVLWKFAWGPIVSSLETREHRISDDIEQARRNNEESRQLLAQYEAKLTNATVEVRALLEEARRDAEQVKQSILAEAKAGAEAERTRALHDIDAAADAAMESLAKKSADIAVELAGKILQSKLNTADHARLISEAMAKFPASSAN